MRRISKLILGSSATIVGLILSCATLSACIQEGPSSRLKSYCFTHQITGTYVAKRQLEILDYLYKREGYSTGLGLPGRVEASTFQYFASPIVDYSTNINGGNPDKPLKLGSLTFEGNRDFLQKQGGIIGLRVGVNGRHLYGGGRYLDFHADGSLARSTDYGLRILQNSQSVCSKNHIYGLWYVDVCATSARTKKDLTDSVVQTAGFGVERLLTSLGNTYHEVSAGVVRRFEKSYSQNQLLLGLDTIHTNGISSAVSLTVGEHLVDKLSTKFKIDAKIGAVIFARSASLSLSYSEAKNGKILDFDQEEVNRSISIQYALHPKFTVSLSYSDTNSNIDYFDHSEPSFGVQFSPVEFR